MLFRSHPTHLPEIMLVHFTLPPPRGRLSRSRIGLKPAAALQACKRLMKQSTREQLEQAVRLENEEFSARVRSAEAKEAFAAFLEKRPPNFSKIITPVPAVAAVA